MQSAKVIGGNGAVPDGSELDRQLAMRFVSINPLNLLTSRPHPQTRREIARAADFDTALDKPALLVRLRINLAALPNPAADNVTAFLLDLRATKRTLLLSPRLLTRLSVPLRPKSRLRPSAPESSRQAYLHCHVSHELQYWRYVILQIKHRGEAFSLIPRPPRITYILGIRLGRLRSREIHVFQLSRAFFFSWPSIHMCVATGEESIVCTATHCEEHGDGGWWVSVAEYTRQLQHLHQVYRHSQRNFQPRDANG